jgi:hypothetical protein
VPTRADDLKPGMYVAIIYRAQPDTEPYTNMFGQTVRPTVYSYDGQPLKILAVSLPFVCVQYEGKQFALDIREIAVQRLTPQYVKAMQPPPKKSRKRAEKEGSIPTYVNFVGGPIQ